MDSTPLEESDLERNPTIAADPRSRDGGAFSSVLREERRRILRQAVADLPAQRRKCVTLWAYQELTYEQIAAVMRLSIGTVKAHLAQARRQLETLAAEAASEPRGGS